MKFLLLVGSLEVGGAETQLSLLAKGLAAEGHEVHFATFSGNGPLGPFLRESGVTLHTLMPPGLPGILHLFTVFIVLTRLVLLSRRLRPDVLQAYLPLTCFMAALAGRITGVKRIVIGRRALGTHQDYRLSAKLIDRAANFLSHAITANAIAVQKDHARRDRIKEERIDVIANAIQADRFTPDARLRQDTREVLGVTHDDIFLLCVGNLIPYKGHADLIAALGMLPDDVPKPKLFLAGRHETLGLKLTAQAQDAAVDFTLLGPRRDIPELLQAADIFVLPSHEEGSSNALLEAVVSGTPAVATLVGGNAELLLDGTGGWLCEAQAPSTLALALSEALKNPPQGQERAEKARTAALEGRDVRALVHHHMRLYDRIAPLGGIIGISRHVSD